MQPTDFNAYKRRMRGAIRVALAAAPPRALDEAGFPAYSHRNPLINWLFWQRLRTVMQHITRRAPSDQVLDFGCGSGVMLPFLAGVSRKVLALDTDLGPLRRMQEHVAFPSNIETFAGDAAALRSWPSASLDLITALDVLEHVADLDSVLDGLLRLLKPGGELIVSGPTENLLYRIGRSIAGPEYSGDYHERGIGEVRRRLDARLPVHSIATLYWPLSLFEVFAASPP